MLLAIAALKIVTTSLTISSGGSGGVFGPSMVIGGCMGAAFGQIGNLLAPEWFPTPQIYAIVGMAGFFAGCAHAPFSTIIMVSEITGSYKLLLPSMWVCMLCFLLGQRWSLYSKQMPSRLESPAHRGDFVIDLLEGIRVSEVYRPLANQRLIPEGMSLDDVVHQLAETTQMYFPVVDQNDRMVGIFSANDVRSYLFDESLWQLANARDLMTTKVVTLSLDDDLNTAMRHFTNLNVDELPVIDSGESGRVLGMLRRKETIAAYNRRLVELKRRDA
jgi:CIC family chloride channel protein